MAKLTLYHAAPSRSAVTRWMLEEVGEPYDIHFLSLSKGDNRAPDYLADAFPKAGLNVPVGDPRRGIYLKWLFFGPSCIEPAITDRAYPRKEEPRRGALGYGDFETTMNVAAKGVSAGRYLMGDQFTAADVVIGSALRWGTMFKLIPERAEFAAYVGRLGEREALKRADAKDKALMPAPAPA